MSRKFPDRIAIGINGACGRMGQCLLACALNDPAVRIALALEAPGHPHLGRDLGEAAGMRPVGIVVRSETPLDQHLDVMIDFSQPEGTMAALAVCLQHRWPLVVATTGHTIEQRQEIEAAAHEIPLLLSPNMSLAVNVLMALARQAAALLKGRGFDVEILERHHRYKKDSPSGTALHLASIIQEQMGQSELRHGRHGSLGERSAHEIGVHAIRVGDNVGEHTIIFSTLGETLELIHRAHDRDCYARGALQAAKYLAGRPPGRYSMQDVLGL